MDSVLTLPQLITTVISAQVAAAIISGIVTIWVTSKQTRSTVDKIGADISALQFSLREEQIRDIIGRRMEAYQELFYTVQRNTSDRRDEGPPPDAEWAKKFLKQLNICHARYGVFLSQDIYTRLWTFRGALRTVAKKVETNQPISEADLVSLDYLWSNNLAANLKNEMLGYEPLTFDRFKSIATAKP